MVCDLDGVAADACTIDALARLQLAARRLGLELRLRRVSGELTELIAFAGLGDVLLEPGREAEEREEPLRAEEERELRDPAA